MKSWVIFTQNSILRYCSFLFIENLTFHCFPFHFPSDWPPTSNPKKEKMRKVSPYLISLLLCTLSYIYLLQLSAIFFPNNMEGSKRSTTHLVIFAVQQKTSKKKKKKDTTLWQNVCCQTIHQIASSLWLQTVGKTCGLRNRNGTMIHSFSKTKDWRQHALVTYTKWVLKMGSSLVLRVQRLE